MSVCLLQSSFYSTFLSLVHHLSLLAGSDTKTLSWVSTESLKEALRYDSQCLSYPPRVSLFETSSAIVIYLTLHAVRVLLVLTRR